MIGDDWDPAALVAEAQRIAEERQRGIDLQGAGFGALTAAQIDEFERRAQDDRGFFEELLGFSRQSIPFIGQAFKVDEDLDRARENIRRGRGKLDADEQADALGRIAEDARPSARMLGIPTGDIGAGLRESAVLMSEMALSGGAGAAVARAAGGRAAAVATARYASQILGAPAAREGLGQIIGDGGAATANVIQRALPGLKLSDAVAEELAELDEETFAQRFIPMLREKRSLISGFAEDVVRSGVESAGGAVLKGMGRLGQLRPQDVLRAMNLRALQKVAAQADDVSALSLRGAAYDGAWAELGEEFAEGVISEGLFGESPLDGLPETFDELAVTVAVSMLPGSAAALWRKAHAKRREELRRRVLGDESTADGEPAGRRKEETSTGGDVSAPGEATVERQDVEPGVFAERAVDIAQQEADVQAFREAYREREGRDAPSLEPVPQGELSGEAALAQRFFEQRGVQTTFVRAKDGEALESEGFSPAEGRAVVTLGSQGTFGVALHEAMHTWAQQQDPVRLAQVDQELRSLDPEFLGRVDAYRRATAPGVEPGSRLDAEESVATTAQLLGPLVQYIASPKGASDFAAVVQERPGVLRRTLEAVRDWLASWVPRLQPSQRRRAEATLEALTPEGATSGPELAARILDAVDEIRPALASPEGQRRTTKDNEGQATDNETPSGGAGRGVSLEGRTAKDNEGQSEEILASPLGERESADLAAEDAAYDPNRFARPLDDAALEAAGITNPNRLTASFLEDAAIVSRWDRFQRAFSDEFIALERYQRAVESLSPAQGKADPISAARRHFGKLSDRAARIDQKYVQPIKKLLAANKIGVEPITDYLYARHAEERNQRFLDQYEERQRLKVELRAIKRGAREIPRDQQIEDGIRGLERRIAKLDNVRVTLPEGVSAQEYFHEVAPLSGMKSSDARAIRRRLGGQEGFQKIGVLVDQMNRATLRGMLDDQLITQEQFDEMSGMYKHYVPLRSDEADGSTQPRSAGLQAARKQIRRALGRRSKADSPLIFSVVQALGAAQQGVKNEVGLEFRDFLQENVSVIESAERTAERDEGTGEVLLAKNELHVKVKGRDVALRIENQDLADALKRSRLVSLPDALRLYTKAFGIWRGLVTSYNPAFVTSNAVRDIQTALINAGSVAKEHGIPDAELRLEVFRGMRSAAATTYRYERGQRGDGDLALFDEYSKNGGQIGTFTSPTFKEQMDQMQRDVRLASAEGRWAALRRGGLATVEWIEDVNRAVETAARFSLYKSLRERDVSPADAALAARQLTVDFSQKGTLGSVVSSIYAFFSASVGGTRRMVQELARSKVGQAIAAGLVAEGFIATILNESLSAEDDDGLTFYSKIPEYEKEAHHILMIPGGSEPLKLKMPWGYSAFHNLGRLAAEAVMGKKDAGEFAGSMLRVTLANFNPLGAAPDLAQLVAPTALEPGVQIFTNTDFTGAPIARPRNPFGVDLPRYRDTRESTWGPYKRAAEFLNDATGGDSVEPGAADWTGEHVAHLVEFFGGGLFKTTQRAYFSVTDAAEGTWDPKTTPFIRQVYGARTEFVDSANFYEALDDIERMRARIKDAKEAGDIDEAREMERRFAPVLGLRRAGRAVRSASSDRRDDAYQLKGKEREAKFDESNAAMKAWYRDYLIALHQVEAGRRE